MIGLGYKRQSNIPVSPYIFRQELYLDDPWKMLIICMMLNQTSYKQVNSVKDVFFENFPDPFTFLKTNDEKIIEIIRPLGFYNRRCKLFRKFTEKWVSKECKSIDDLPGIGKYASDAWKVFQEGNINISVEDKELKKYVIWARNRCNS